MEIRKIGQLAPDEIEILAEAGHLLGKVKMAFEAAEITELDETAKDLLDALKEVIEKVNK